MDAKLWLFAVAVAFHDSDGFAFGECLNLEIRQPGDSVHGHECMAWAVKTDVQFPFLHGNGSTRR